jgi:hypothetical protein
MDTCFRPFGILTQQEVVQVDIRFLAVSADRLLRRVFGCQPVCEITKKPCILLADPLARLFIFVLLRQGPPFDRRTCFSPAWRGRAESGSVLCRIEFFFSHSNSPVFLI